MSGGAKPASQPNSLAKLPLYLYGQAATLVDVNGPAFLIKIEYKAPIRYPFVRISRVISGAQVEWKARALSACQQNGMPIVFIDAAGVTTGYLQPVQSKPSRLNAVIEEMLDRADWSTHYCHWLRAQRMDLLQNWRRGYERAGRNIEESDFNELVRQHVYRPETEQHSNPIQTPQATALSAHFLRALHQAGLQPRYWGEHGEPLELAADMTNLLSLALYLEMFGMGAAVRGDNAIMLRILHSFSARLNELVPHILGSLHRRFKSQLEEWR